MSVLVGLLAVGLFSSVAEATHENWKPAAGKTKRQLKRAGTDFITKPDRALITKRCAPRCESLRKGRKGKGKQYGIVCGSTTTRYDRVGAVFKKTKGAWKHISPERYSRAEPKRSFFSDSVFLACSLGAGVTEV